MLPLMTRRILNIGEIGAPMNDAVWAESPAWPLVGKMRPDFDTRLLAAIDDFETERPSLASARPRPVQRTILAGNKGRIAVATGNGHAIASISTAGGNIDHALSRSGAAVRLSVEYGKQALQRFFSRIPPRSPDPPR
jgi:hypothetical protein